MNIGTEFFFLSVCGNRSIDVFIEFSVRGNIFTALLHF